ncbi:MAG: hypothetical protein H0T62_13330 [Parachlamydiaceae bacterium]|nr:hypothetical protein [Parachlamydiaceae bacterium]
MKKKDFSKLALKGITAGLLLSTPAIQAAQSAGFAGCGASSPSQGYGVQGGHGCGAMPSQQSQGYYQGQQNPGYYQGQQNQGYYQGQQNPNYNQNYNQSWDSQSTQQTQRAYGTPRLSQSCAAQSSYSSSCGGSGKCGGAIAIGDEPTRPSNQKDYFDSSYENQNDSMTAPDRSRTIPQDKSRTIPQERYLSESQMTTSQKPITEAELMMKLDAQGKASYKALSPEGKAMALTLANEDNGRKYADKNLAVKMAAEKSASMKKMGN